MYVSPISNFYQEVCTPYLNTLSSHNTTAYNCMINIAIHGREYIPLLSNINASDFGMEYTMYVCY